MTREHPKGFICTVYPIAYGHYRYLCTNAHGQRVNGTVEAMDEVDAMALVFQIIDKL